MIVLGVCAAVARPRSSTPPIPELLAIHAASRVDDPDPDREVIEFQLDAADRPANYLILLGSLGDAGHVENVRLETISRSRTSPVSRDATLRSGAISIDKTRSAAETLRVAANRTIRQAAKPALTVEDALPESEPRLFFLQLGSDHCRESSYRPVETRLAARSAGVGIWLDATQDRRPPSVDFAWMAECLEQQILPKIAALYGTIDDLDGDGGLAVCATPRLAELPAAGVPVEGLVQFNDFLPGLSRPFSNQADVMFVSADLQPGPHAVAILAHEAAHLAVFSRRREADRQRPVCEDDWLNEGLAHYAEIACGGDGSNLTPRIAAFRQHSALSPLLVTDAQQQGLWRDPGSRGAAWSFLNWLAEEHGPEMLTAIASETGVGCDKIERIAQQPFAELFRRWTLSLWRDSSAPTATELRAGQDVTEIPLRGSAHAGCRLTLPAGEHVGLRVSAPQGCRLQITVAEADGSSPRYWTVR